MDSQKTKQAGKTYLGSPVLSSAFASRQLSFGLASFGTLLTYVLVGHGAVGVLL